MSCGTGREESHLEKWVRGSDVRGEEWVVGFILSSRLSCSWLNRIGQRKVIYRMARHQVSGTQRVLSCTFQSWENSAEPPRSGTPMRLGREQITCANFRGGNQSAGAFEQSLGLGSINSGVGAAFLSSLPASFPIQPAVVSTCRVGSGGRWA